MSPLIPLLIPGDLTEPAAPALIERVREACAASPVHVILNLPEAREVDPSGLGALIRALKIARDGGGDLRIGQTSPELRRMLSLTGLDQVVPVEESIAA